jgi:hypothetical protein
MYSIFWGALMKLIKNNYKYFIIFIEVIPDKIPFFQESGWIKYKKKSGFISAVTTTVSISSDVYYK